MKQKRLTLLRTICSLVFISFGDTLAESSKVLDLYNRGVEKLNAHDTDGAIADFSRVIELNPNAGDAYHRRGVAREQQRDYKGAIADFSMAISLDPNSVRAYTNRGVARVANGDVDGGIRDYNRAISIDPKHSPAYHNRALARAGTSAEQAIDDLTKAIQLDVKSRNSYLARASITRILKQLDLSIADYTAALNLKQDAATYIFRGSCKEEKKDFNGAIEDYCEAIKFAPSASDATKHLEALLASIDPLLASKPLDSNAYFKRAHEKSKTQDLDGAIADYSLAIALDPKLGNAISNRGSTRLRKGDIDGAIIDLTRALEIDPKDTISYVNRGKALNRKGDFQAAIKDYNSAISIDPKRANAFSGRAIAFYFSRDWANALSDYHTICRLKSDGQDYIRLMIWSLSRRTGIPKNLANHDLSEYLGTRAREAAGDWYSTLVKFCLDRSSVGAIFAETDTQDAKKASEQRCESFYYIGIKFLLDGNKDAALNYFNKCVGTGKVEMWEHQFASEEMKLIAQSDPVSPRPRSRQ